MTAPLFDSRGVPLPAPLPAGLHVVIGPGLTLVRGGEGRGKSTLLRAIAAGRSDAFLVDPADPRHDDTVARAWLADQRARHARWHDADEAAAIDAFQLAPHLDKPLFMHSAGTRRKVGLVAALACGAPLVLLDGPFAALDARSRGALADALAQGAEEVSRGWVLADYERPAVLADVAFAAEIDLGD